MTQILKFAGLSVFAVLVMLPIQQVSACDVPVFRYALERWPAGIYKIVLFHEHPLNEEKASIVSWLKRSSYENNPFANFVVNTVDMSTEMDDSMRALWKSADSHKTPLLVVRQPDKGIYRRSVWSGQLSQDAAQKVADSPARQEIANRIMGGDAAVWVLVESGNQTRDEAAARFISEQLSKAKKEITFAPKFRELADLEDLEADINFSLVRVSRNDPAEEIFVNMLMYCEPGLFEYQSDPMAFPMFGRGRALYALAGAGITRKNIYLACQTVIGPCSCTVKDLNPGVDMLMIANWKAGIGKSWIDEDIPLAGLGTLANMTGNNESHSPTLLRNILITSGAIIVTIMVLSILILVKRRKK